MKHPIQPIIKDAQGVNRFKANKIVQFLLDEGPFDLNFLARQLQEKRFPTEDYAQLMQLIGYSVSGFAEISAEISLVPDAEYQRAIHPEPVTARDGAGELIATEGGTIQIEVRAGDSEFIFVGKARGAFLDCETS